MDGLSTYVFIKARGEMVASDPKNNLPLIIIRPTIVTSTYREPFPGWIEGIRYVVQEYLPNLNSFPN